MMGSTTRTTTTTEGAVADALGRCYWVLTPPERFALSVEAMARGDEAEADRLEDTCIKRTYTHNDAEFRDRLQRSYTIALLACVNLQKLLAVIRCSGVFVDNHREFAHPPTLVATCAFLFGRQYGMWECGAIEQVDLPDLDDLKAEVKGWPDLKQQLK